MRAMGCRPWLFTASSDATSIDEALGIIARAAEGRLAVLRLLNSKRGWDTHHTPVDDAIWALDEARSRLGGLPVALVGHSLGGRAALLAGSTPGVRAVVEAAMGAVIGVGNYVRLGTTVDDAVERLEAGADLLQAYTAFVYGGPRWPSRLVRELG